MSLVDHDHGLSRRSLLKGAAGLGALAAGGSLLSGCSGERRAPNELVLWGVGGDSRAYQAQILEKFSANHPDISVAVNNVPGTGDGDATAIITAVRGGTGPDLWYMDRFSCAQYAALGLLEPITGLIEQYEDADFLDQYLPFAVNELKLGNDIYGLPAHTDTRVLYYNKKLLRDAGIDPSEFDPSNGPPTVEQVEAANEKLIKIDGRGNYTSLGLIPWDNQGWGYTWSLANGASYFDDSKCGVDLTAQPILTAYEYLYDWTRRMDYKRVDAFKATYEPPNHPPAQTSFLGQHQGFVIGTNGYRTSVQKYAPDLDLGYTPLPVFAAGDQPYTWSGGFSLVAPRGSSLSREMWELMKFYCGIEGQAIYVPQVGGLPTQVDLVRGERGLFEDASFFIDQLQFSTSRPPFPVSQIWWEAMASAQENVKLGSRTALEALQVAQARVGPQMDLYCPFTMPQGYGRTGI